MSADLLHLDFKLRRPGFKLEVDETLPLDGVTAVFGPSGSGKTTLLRAIAGLELPDEGCIRFGDAVWFDSEAGNVLATHRRNVAYVFQDVRLFSHLDVRGNLDFAARRAARAGRSPDFETAVEASGIGSLLERPAASLSGGESRRVALTRAILSCPDLLLLDEPLTGLDRAARRAILPYLRELPERSRCPVLYVSHDLEEVAALASQIVVIDSGQVAASGPVADVSRTLDLGPLSDAAGPASLVEARIQSVEEGGGLMRLTIGDVPVYLPAARDARSGETVRLFIDARDVAIALRPPGPVSIRNVLPAHVHRIVSKDISAEVLIDLEIGGAIIRAQITRAALEDLSLETGQAVHALMKSMRLAGDFR